MLKWYMLACLVWAQLGLAMSQCALFKTCDACIQQVKKPWKSDAQVVFACLPGLVPFIEKNFEIYRMLSVR
jgi:hypothetical protein